MIFNFFIIIFVLSFNTFVRGQAGVNLDWGYRNGNFLNPDQWKTVYKSCAGNRQSPININKGEVQYWNRLKPVTVKKEQKTPQSVYLKRSETTIYLNFNDIWTVSFNNEGCFKPLSIHWHWGSDKTKGSEHTLDEVKYPLEGHLVTYNCNLYNKSADAVNLPSGLHVFGMLYKEGEENPIIKTMQPDLKKLVNDPSATITEISPIKLFPTNLDKYYRYEGSLTTPPCTENVVWTVFNEIQTVSPSQMELFRALKYGKPETGQMVDNFRPVMQLSNSSEYLKRIIFASFNNGQTTVPWVFLVSLSTIMMATHYF